MKNMNRQLDCLYSITDLIGNSRDIESVLRKVVAFLPQGYADPQSVRARILFEGREFQTCDFSETSRKQHAELVVDDRHLGSLEVFSLGTRVRFSRGDQAFLSAVADQLAKTVERLKARQIQKDILSLASHELRTPLAVTRNCLYLLAKNDSIKLSEEAQRYTAMAERNCDRMIRLINDYLDLDKIESGRMEFKSSPLDLVPLVEEAIQANQSLAEVSGTRYVLVKSPAHVQVSAEAGRLTQVMANLLSNAAKVSPRGSRVEISVTQHAGKVRVAVRDHGPGVAENFRSRIFQKFASRPVGSQKKGSGLGLSISRAIVEAHGGEMGFDMPDGGAVFYFDLPALRAKGTAATAQDTAAPTQTAG
jgi:signal transduction histidine kinase